MKEEIKALRVKLDGLAQLTKNLTTTYYVVDTKSLENIDAKEYLAKCEKYGRDVQPISIPKMNKVVETSKEVEKTYDSLILAKAWLGKILGELGDSTPYANDGKRETVKDIEPAADTEDLSKRGVEWDYIEINWDTSNHIEKVDWLREEIKLLIDKVGDLQINFENFDLIKSYSIQITSITNTFNHLSEARFWLGFELGRIRDNEQKHS